MFRNRIIPVLLLQNNALVKSERFKNHRYIGDAINAVKILNKYKADEIILLNISPKSTPSLSLIPLIKQISEECEMPFGIGGGISTIQEAETILKNGAEKVVIRTEALKSFLLVTEIAERFGSSSTTVCIDIKKNLFGKYKIYPQGFPNSNQNVIEFCKQVESAGAGEIILQSVDADGSMKGYDIPLIRQTAESVNIPLIALGGVGNMQHIKELFEKTHANAAAAGSLFVYFDNQRGVLINYPEKSEIFSHIRK